MFLLALLACAGDTSPTVGADTADTPTSQPPADDEAWDDDATIFENCFPYVQDQGKPWPDYDAIGPVVGTHCSGTNQQDIRGIEKVVFLGDSITAGTPPTPTDDYYANVLLQQVEARFGPVETQNCAVWGARTRHLASQIETCFPEPEPKRTLVVITAGGNDIFAYAEQFLDGTSLGEIASQASDATAAMDAALRTLTDPERFPGGSFVIFGDIYEYTDGTGDMYSCPSAEILELGGDVPELRGIYVSMNEAYMRSAVETGTDMVFMLERFCGHGWHHEDPTTECYQGAAAPLWFDATCLHPNVEGHHQLAKMFLDVIEQ